nr:uncharacterized protein LOC104119069 [Nicotiana tomentosiformis]
MQQEGSNKVQSAGNFGGSSSGGGGGGSSRAVSGLIKATGDPNSRVGLVGDSSSSGGPYALGVNVGRGMTQPASSASTTSALPPPTRGTPAPAGRGVAKGGAQSWRGPNCFYDMRGSQSSEASPVVVTLYINGPIS